MRALALARRPADLAAVSLAVSLGETTVLTVAPDDDEDCRALMAWARAAGAARTVRLWDDALRDVDYLGSAIALAGAARALFGDLAATAIVCGSGAAGAVGPAVADRLGVPHLGRVIGAAVDGERVIARRRAGKVVHRFAAAPPLLLCVAPGRPPAAPPPEAATVEAWGLAEAQLSAMELTPRRHFRAHPVAAAERAGEPKLLELPSLIERLRADGLVP